MFDFGLSMGELMVIAMIALIVVGPKDLPKMLRTIARFVGKLRGMAGEFQRHLNSAIRETGIEDVKRDVKNMTNFTVTADVGKQMSEEFKKQGDEIKKMLDAPPPPPPTPPQEVPPVLAEPPSPAPPDPAFSEPEQTKA